MCGVLENRPAWLLSLLSSLWTWGSGVTNFQIADQDSLKSSIIHPARFAEGAGEAEAERLHLELKISGNGIRKLFMRKFSYFIGKGTYFFFLTGLNSINAKYLSL